MANDTLETTSRLVAWRINSLDNIVGGSLMSREFLIGKWYWFLEYAKIGEAVYFKLTPKDAQSLPFPIASFTFHVFCSKGSNTIGEEEECTDLKLPYGSSLLCVKTTMSTLHSTTPVTFCLEFLDLKMENGNDGKTYSIWNDEYPEESSPDELITIMLSESIYTDVIINTRDGSIKAHRAVLAVNSPVFKTMFYESYIEKEISTVNISDMSLEACRAMLNFVYGKRSGKELRVHSMELIVAADKYDIVNFKKACEATLCEDVGYDNVFERLKCAHTYDLSELKTTCLFYLLKMGMVFQLHLQQNYFSFLREADRELIVLVSKACLDGWQST